MNKYLCFHAFLTLCEIVIILKQLLCHGGLCYCSWGTVSVEIAFLAHVAYIADDVYCQ